MPQYYNVTFHTVPAHQHQVLRYLRTQLIPTWLTYPHWHSPKLLQVETPEPNSVAFALQWELAPKAQPFPFELHSDPCITQLVQALPGAVLPFDTTMTQLPLR